MRAVLRSRALLLAAAVMVSGEARGADRSQLSKLKTVLTPKKLVSPELRTSETRAHPLG